MSNGYSDKLIAIDDELVALGRPLPPVVSWLSGGQRGDFNARTVAWRQQLEAWEEANPQAAIRWSELRQDYITQERHELRARYDDDAWNYEQLRHIGCPDKFIDTIRGTMRETQSWRAARDWMLDLPWSLMLVGGTGCGKSVAAAWVAHQRLMRGFGVHWVDCPRQSEASMYGVEAELRRFQCRTAHTLVLDDLGSGRRERETKPGEANHLWLAWLDDVLGSRANEGRKTVITTNRTAVELKAWLGERLVDRLRDGTVSSSSERSMRGAVQQQGAKR